MLSLKRHFPFDLLYLSCHNLYEIYDNADGFYTSKRSALYSISFIIDFSAILFLLLGFESCFKEYCTLCVVYYTQFFVTKLMVYLVGQIAEMILFFSTLSESTKL